MNMFPSEVMKGIAVYHLPMTGGLKQPYPASPSATIQGAFLPLDRHAAALEGGQYTDPHDLFIDASIDIRKGDKLIIDGVSWYVKHVFTANFGTLAHKRATVSHEI